MFPSMNKPFQGKGMLSGFGNQGGFNLFGNKQPGLPRGGYGQFGQKPGFPQPMPASQPMPGGFDMYGQKPTMPDYSQGGMPPPSVSGGYMGAGGPDPTPQSWQMGYPYLGGSMPRQQRREGGSMPRQLRGPTLW